MKRSIDTRLIRPPAIATRMIFSRSNTNIRTVHAHVALHWPPVEQSLTFCERIKMQHMRALSEN
jgi:hypothetical protein